MTTRPKSESRFPAVLIIQGMGPHRRGIRGVVAFDAIARPWYESGIDMRMPHPLPTGTGWGKDIWLCVPYRMLGDPCPSFGHGRVYGLLCAIVTT